MRVTTTLFQLGLRHPVSIAAARTRAGGDGAMVSAICRCGEAPSVPMAVLSTCERVEAYMIASASQVAAVSADIARVLSATSDARIERRVGSAAAGHLFAVAAGLESRFIGEDHILGQVSRMPVVDNGDRFGGATLRRLQESAVARARRVRKSTGLGRLSSSCVDAVASMLAEHVRADAAGTLTILGSGMLARDLAARLLDSGAGAVTIVARHVTRAIEQCAGLDVRVRPMEQLAATVEESPIIIAATSSPSFLVDRSVLLGSVRERLLVDLGVPPNVDPDVAHLAGVTLTTFRDLLPSTGGVDGVVDRARGMTEAAATRWAERWITGSSGTRACPRWSEIA